MLSIGTPEVSALFAILVAVACSGGMSTAPLFAPARHTTLAGEPWSDARARAALAAIVEDIERAYGGDELVWPNHPDDLEGDPDVPFRTLYLGAGGVVWALARLARDGHAEPRIDLPGLSVALYERWLEAPEFESLYPAPHPSLLMGSAGLLLLADELAPDAGAPRPAGGGDRGERAQPDARAAVGLARARCWRRWPWPSGIDGAERWAALWRASAAWLLAEWRGEVWEQDMYGRRTTTSGPGHGFAGNVHALLRGRALLEPDAAAEVERARRGGASSHLAQHDGACVQWPAVLGETLPSEKTRTQWCHGAPGMVIALGALLRPTPELDALFLGGGEMTWAAGPLRASSSLCHGTAGNGFAFLRLFERYRRRAVARPAPAPSPCTRSARWTRRDARSGRGRYTLFTGDAGVAVFLAACLAGDARFPVVDG